MINAEYMCCLNLHVRIRYSRTYTCRRIISNGFSRNSMFIKSIITDWIQWFDWLCSEQTNNGPYNTSLYLSLTLTQTHTTLWCVFNFPVQYVRHQLKIIWTVCMPDVGCRWNYELVEKAFSRWKKKTQQKIENEIKQTNCNYPMDGWQVVQPSATIFSVCVRKTNSHCTGAQTVCCTIYWRLYTRYTHNMNASMCKMDMHCIA